MQRDPALDHSGRFGAFLDRAIADFKPNTEGQQPMPDEAKTTIAPNQFKAGDELVSSITGAGSLATALTQRIQAAKARHAAANTKVDAAFGKLDSVSVTLEQVAQKVEAEADAALAQIGQVSNFGE